MFRMMKNGSVLLQGGDVLGYYDLEKKEFQPIPIHGVPSQSDQFEAVVHRGSLASPARIARGDLFVFRFEREADKAKIIKEQHWQVLGYLLVLKAFSPNIQPSTVLFKTTPIWIGFMGLLLEHQLSIVIERIASAAGRVLEVDPADNNPKDTDGYRARVEVNIEEPIRQGVMVQTINLEPVWISFIYVGMPYHSCKRCFKIGHDTYYYNIPDTNIVIPAAIQEPGALQVEFYQQPQPELVGVEVPPPPPNMTDEAQNHFNALFGGIASRLLTSPYEVQAIPMETANPEGFILGQPIISFPESPKPNSNLIINLPYVSPPYHPIESTTELNQHSPNADLNKKTIKTQTLTKINQIPNQGEHTQVVPEGPNNKSGCRKIRGKGKLKDQDEMPPKKRKTSVFINEQASASAQTLVAQIQLPPHQDLGKKASFSSKINMKDINVEFVWDMITNPVVNQILLS
ncbi:hypothetical protein IFM89_020010 [Coptis chinensis]|uniref:DUF4283 domain-containing protein n=1 Tax=Coptis chinensis TaxID=261450 RepID=A0A835IPE2_9MAGN|nr:hypothetical protein IFM89_020010 [Coptis chinensis]